MLALRLLTRKQSTSKYRPVATFSKLLRKISDRFLILGKSKENI